MTVIDIAADRAIIEADREGDYSDVWADGRFAAAARTRWPAALDRVEELERENRHLREQINPAQLPMGLFHEYGRLDSAWQEHVLTIDRLRTALASMTAARDELGTFAYATTDVQVARIAQLRAVGSKP